MTPIETNDSKGSMSIEQTCREHGAPPFSTLVLHGGPGAAGSAHGLARDVHQLLDGSGGVLEPYSRALSLDEQLSGLSLLIKEHCRGPVPLVGHSFGAMLGLVLTAREPQRVSRLILVGSGVFEDRYAELIMQTRLSRLSPSEQEEARLLLKRIAEAGATDLDLSRFGCLMSLADGFDLIEGTDSPTHCDLAVFQAVWPEMAALRTSGKLLGLASQVQCPVLAVHGLYDSHPIKGVCEPLSRTVKDFRCTGLEKCGHEPWRERMARDRFLAILRQELAPA